MEKFNVDKYNIEKISTNPNANIFSINKASDITNELIEHLFSASSMSEIVFRPNNFTLDDSNYLDTTLSKDNLYYQLGFIAHKSNLQRSNITTDISLTSFNNIDELRTETNRTIDEYFFKEWPEFVYEKLKNDYAIYVNNYFPLEYSWKIFHQKRYIGLISMFPSTDCLKNKLMQVGWIWLDQDIDLAVRKKAHGAVTNHLIDTCDDMIQAGIGIFNIKSKKFFCNIGFEPKCIHIIKK
ncbi:MAG: hypothetical protein HQK49_09055 [Oligoflexia bacterium]|nr:hypothetical protein [Oligoflexia bacterium]